MDLLSDAVISSSFDDLLHFKVSTLWVSTDMLIEFLENWSTDIPWNGGAVWEFESLLSQDDAPMR
jgi:hypothetical protein